jgi:hypothetical protein
MKLARTFGYLLAATPVLMMSCGSSGGGNHDGGNPDAGGSDGGDGSADAPPPSVTCTDGTIVANEMNDYAFSSSFDLPPISVKPSSNLTFDWSGVTQDFLGHSLSTTTDLNTILVLLVGLPPATFETQLNADTFAQGSLLVTPPPNFMPTGGVTSATLYDDFSAGGVAVTAANSGMYLDPTKYPPAANTYVVAAQTGTSLGSNIRMLQAFQLDSTSSNTTVALTNTSTKLTYAANLHSLHPTGVPAGTAALTLDWGQMKTNALGANFIPTNITSALVGHYTQTPAQLETEFLDLQTLATDLYTVAIPSGTVLDFTMLMDSAGRAFPGVDSTGTWLVGLTCGNCRNPAPWYLAILVPAAQPCAQ